MIPFTQYHLPDGRRSVEEFPCSSEPIQHLADRIIAAGGRFEAEILSTGHISLTCVARLDADEELDIAIILCRNEHGFVARAVEMLVAKAAQRFGRSRLYPEESKK